jgi:hypothetical protein
MAVGAYQVEVEFTTVIKGFVFKENIGLLPFRDFMHTYTNATVPGVTQIQINNNNNAISPTTINAFHMAGISADGQRMSLFAGSRSWFLELDEPFDPPPAPANVETTVARESRNIVEISWQQPFAWKETLIEYVLCRNGVEIARIPDGQALTFTDIDVEAGDVVYTVQAIYDNSFESMQIRRTVRIIDNYEIPFIEHFAIDLPDNGWSIEQSQDMVTWQIFTDAAMTGGRASGVRFRGWPTGGAISSSLISKPLDAKSLSSVYVAFTHRYSMVIPNENEIAKLYIEVSNDGIDYDVVDVRELAQNTNWYSDYVDISQYAAGHLFNVRLRIDGTSGDHLPIIVFNDIAVTEHPPMGDFKPSDIIATVNEDNIKIHWKNPDGYYALSHQQTNVTSGLGNLGVPFIAAHKFDLEDIGALSHLYLNSISAYIFARSTDPLDLGDFTIRLAVFVDGDRVVMQNIDTDDIIYNRYNTFKLNTPLALSDVKEELIIGIEVLVHEEWNWPIGVDATGRFVAHKGDLFSVDGGETWEYLHLEISADVHRNWAIVGDVQTAEFDATRVHNIFGYNLYKEGQKINDALINSYNQSAIVDKEFVCYSLRAYSPSERGLSALSDCSVFDALAPAIIRQPQSASYVVGDTADPLSIVAMSDEYGGALSYRWYSNTSNTATGGTFISSNPLYTPSTSAAGDTYYYVVVTNTNEELNGQHQTSITSDVAHISVAAAAIVTSAPELEKVIADVFPNPTSGIFTLHVATEGVYTLIISDLSGKTLLRQTITDTSTQMNISQYPSGVYFIRIEDNKGGISTYKIIKN